MHKESNQTFYTCYAESKDGKQWNKVNLDVVPGTNIVDICNRDAATVWLDRFEKDPQKRWKFFNIERRAADKRWQVVLKYSSDGRKWSRGVAQSGDVYDRSLLSTIRLRTAGLSACVTAHRCQAVRGLILKTKIPKHS